MTENEKLANEFQPTISLISPLQDYKKLIQEKVQSDELLDDEVMQQNYAKIAESMRQTIWELLFGGQQPPSSENLAKAAECLREHKMDACFYAPWEYNDWIPKVRDEVLKRKMFDFWNEMVKGELGLCWAKDSDYFDNMEDDKPAEFYKYAGCEAPFSRDAKRVKLDPEVEKAPKAEQRTPSPAATSATTSPNVEQECNVPKTISLETPTDDYRLILEHQLNVDADDEEAYNRIFEEVRNVIWSLLFDSEVLTSENFAKAADTLEAYKGDACFFNPWDYNKWIVQVRDQLFARQYFLFWKDVIVMRELGLCWYKDSDFFDNKEDSAPLEFYKSGNALMIQWEMEMCVNPI